MRDWNYFLTGIILTVLVVGAVFLGKMSRPRAPYLNGEYPRAQGPADAKVQIIEYSDFQCPACQYAQETLKELMRDYPDKVRLVFQHYPLEGHRWSRLAHQAAECASVGGQFWPYHDRLYANQSVWTKHDEAPLEVFLQYAREEGLNLEDFGRCLSDERTSESIEEEWITGGSLGVKSTPSFFVNGNLVVGTQNLRQQVEKALQS